MSASGDGYEELVMDQSVSEEYTRKVPASRRSDREKEKKWRL
jgi:hypothetical protein